MTKKIWMRLENITPIQKFWVNYLRDANTEIVNQNTGNEHAGFNDKLHSDGIRVTLGKDVYVINKNFFTYVQNRGKANQKYIDQLQDPSTGEYLLIFDNNLETIEKISYKKFTWFFNSETYDDIQEDYTVLDELHCMPTGFKANYILARSYTKNTKIFYYDFNSYMLKFKRRLLETWDGYNYPQFINNYGFKPDLLPDNHNTQTLEENWRQELYFWGGEDAFARMWNFQKNFDYKFIELDLFSNFERIEINGNSTCWFSNIFFYPTLFLEHDEGHIWHTYDNFINHLKTFGPRIYVKDPFGWSTQHERGV